MHPKGLILAAGDSSRMGVPKALLSVQGQSAWLRLALSGLVAGCASSTVLVERGLLQALEAEIPPLFRSRLEILSVPEELRRLGPVGSLIHGLREGPSAEGWLVCPVDHPFVAQTTLRMLIQAEGEIRVPVMGERRGHPLFLARGQRDPVLALEGKGTLRDLLRNHPDLVREVPVNDPAIHWNCNRIERFRAFHDRFSTSRRESPPGE